jgi:hypothetical protein
MHEEPGEEIVGIDHPLGGTFRAFVPVACDGSFQLEPFEGQGRTQEVSRESLETNGVTGRHGDPIVDRETGVSAC